MILWKKGKVQIKTKFNGVIRPLSRSDLWKKNKQTNKAINLFIFNVQSAKNTLMEVLFSCRWRILYEQSAYIKNFTFIGILSRRGGRMISKQLL